MIGAIVAGGPSSRFGGEPKGLHAVGGRRILDRVASAVRSACSEMVLISSIPGASAWLPGVRIVPDGWRRRGSLVGIHAALKYANQPILLVAWDMPFLTGELLQLVRDRSHRSSFAAVPTSDAGLEPFCAVYTPRCLPWIEAALAAEDLRMTRLLERLPEFECIGQADVAAIGDPAHLFFNVNDADDLAAAERVAAPR